MAIVGFEFNSIDVEKKEFAKGNINISNNIAMVDVLKNDLTIGGTKQSGIKFMFEYKSTYEPEYAKIVLGGSVMYLTDEKNAKSILDDWADGKKLNKDIAGQIVNSILTKCNIQSIILANTVNLPPPVPMPKVNVQSKGKGKSSAKDEKKADDGAAKKEDNKESKPKK